MTMTKTPRIKLKDAPALIRDRQPFDSGNMRATISRGVYTVWSYHTPIAGQADGGPWWVSSSPATTTTAQHIRAVRRALEGIQAVTAHV